MVQNFKSAPSSIKSFIILTCWMIPLAVLIIWGKLRQYDEAGLSEVLQGKNQSAVYSGGAVVALLILMINVLVLKKQKIGRIIATLSFGLMVIFYFLKNYASFFNGQIFTTFNFLTFVVIAMMIASLVLLYKKESKAFFMS